LKKNILLLIYLQVDEARYFSKGSNCIYYFLTASFSALLFFMSNIIFKIEKAKGILSISKSVIVITIMTLILSHVVHYARTRKYNNSMLEILPLSGNQIVTISLLQDIFSFKNFPPLALGISLITFLRVDLSGTIVSVIYFLLLVGCGVIWIQNFIYLLEIYKLDLRNVTRNVFIPIFTVLYLYGALSNKLDIVEVEYVPLLPLNFFENILNVKLFSWKFFILETSVLLSILLLGIIGRFIEYKLWYRIK